MTRDDAFILPKPAAEPEILQSSDIKSRISWTPERVALLRELWDRGDKSSAIAAALGCRASAIAVARSRFGLTPRREVTGRPKLREPDEPAHTIERVAFTTSRLMEFCTEKELVAQTGHEAWDWLRVIVKELARKSHPTNARLGGQSDRHVSGVAGMLAGGASRRAEYWNLLRCRRSEEAVSVGLGMTPRG
jgi:hypothetical protein